MQIQLSDHRVTKDYFEAEFVTDSTSGVECAAGFEDRILHCSIIRNYAFGVKIRKVIIEYTLDTNEVGFCPNRTLKTCAFPPKVRALTFQIPEIPQPYWRGSEKRVELRTCVPHPFAISDFNVSYKIVAEFSSRDLDIAPPPDVLIESNMHVQLSP